MQQPAGDRRGQMAGVGGDCDMSGWRCIPRGRGREEAATFHRSRGDKRVEHTCSDLVAAWLLDEVLGLNRPDWNIILYVHSDGCWLLVRAAHGPMCHRQQN